MMFLAFEQLCESRSVCASVVENPLIVPFLLINIHQDGNLVNSCVYGRWIF